LERGLTMLGGWYYIVGAGTGKLLIFLYNWQ
jgi:hypothetical protein